LNVLITLRPLRTDDLTPAERCAIWQRLLNRLRVGTQPPVQLALTGITRRRRKRHAPKLGWCELRTRLNRL
jgi:hypothetical protein